MATITLNLPDELAERVETLNRWLPTILEISLLTLKTPATRTVSEIIEFLASNPSPAEVNAYHGSKRARRRMSHLLDLNRAGLISEGQLQELDELLKLEHLIINLKASLPSDELARA